MSQRSTRSYLATLGAVLTLTLTGCASVSTPAGDVAAAQTDDGRSRAERVFLYQSRVADSLLDHFPLMEVFAEADPELVAAEAHMTRSCSPLTQAVLAHFEGEKPSLGLRFQVFTTLGECERAAQRIDRLLSQRVSATGTI